MYSATFVEEKVQKTDNRQSTKKKGKWTIKKVARAQARDLKLFSGRKTELSGRQGPSKRLLPKIIPQKKKSINQENLQLDMTKKITGSHHNTLWYIKKIWSRKYIKRLYILTNQRVVSHKSMQFKLQLFNCRFVWYCSKHCQENILGQKNHEFLGIHRSVHDVIVAHEQSRGCGLMWLPLCSLLRSAVFAALCPPPGTTHRSLSTMRMFFASASLSQHAALLFSFFCTLFWSSGTAGLRCLPSLNAALREKKKALDVKTIHSASLHRGKKKKKSTNRFWLV